MTDFKPGEIVDITIKGARVLEEFTTEDYRVTVSDLHLSFEIGDGDGPYNVNLASEQVAITRVAPPEWPPQPGDLWRGTTEDEDDDPLMPGSGIWFCRLDLDFEKNLSELQFVPANGDLGYAETNPDKVLKSYDGRMALVHREADHG